MNCGVKMLTAKDIERVVLNHHKLRRRCLNMCAAENCASQTVRSFLSCDLGNRYIVTGNETSNRYIRKLDEEVQKLGRKLFECKFLNWRPLGGHIAGAIVASALLKSGDTIFECYHYHGSMRQYVEQPLVNVKVEQFPWDFDEWAIDLEAAEKKIREKKPKMLTYGMSTGALFPGPIKELKEIAEDIGAYLVSDDSHTLGLIAGKVFPNPLKEGADIVNANTHKTLCGPQGAIIYTNDEKLHEKMFIARRYVMANPYFNRLPALGVLFLEWMKHGEAYASQMVRNAKRLGKALYDHGFKVYCPQKDFTGSNQILVDVTEFGYMGEIARRVGGAHIIINYWSSTADDREKIMKGEKTKVWPFLRPIEQQLKEYYIPPRPKDWEHVRTGVRTSLRISTSEITKIDMKESEMGVIAEFFKRLLMDNEDPSVVAEDVAAFTSNFNELVYSEDKGTQIGPYDLLRLEDHAKV